MKVSLDKKIMLQMTSGKSITYNKNILKIQNIVLH